MLELRDLDGRTGALPQLLDNAKQFTVQDARGGEHNAPASAASQPNS